MGRLPFASCHVIFCYQLIVLIRPIVSLPASVDAHSRHPSSANASSSPCDYVRSLFYKSLSSQQENNNNNALNKHETPAGFFINPHLSVCSKGLTCCTEEMENQFVQRAQQEFQSLLQDSIMNLMLGLKSLSREFDHFFRELLVKSQRDLDAMFMKTYGILYEQNSDLFVALFDNLTSYYTYRRRADGSVLANGDLDVVMDRFYENLYRRMFRMLNQPYQLDDAYWQCMSRHMHQLQPFGQVPDKMKLQMLKAFSAARTFTRALTVGSDVMSAMLTMKSSGECASQIAQLLHCQHCQGVVGVSPCSGHCLAVTSKCLLSYMVFDGHWNDYLDSLLQLLDRLEGPYNIESVINPIDIQISEAIMIFQDRGKEISDKVFAGCGRPKLSAVDRQHHVGRGGLSRTIRAAKINDLRDLRFGPVSARSNVLGGVNMDSLAREMKRRTAPTRGFWRTLPDKLCNSFGASTPTNASEPCWNGTSSVRPELSDSVVDPFDQDTLKRAEIEPAVREMTIRLKHAVNELRGVMSLERSRPPPPGPPTAAPSSIWRPSTKLGPHHQQAATAPGVVQERPRDAGSGFGSSEIFQHSGDHVQTDDEDLLKDINRKVIEEQGSGSGSMPAFTGTNDGSMQSTNDLPRTEMTTIGPIWVDERNHPELPDFEIQMPTTPYLLRPFTRPSDDYHVYEDVTNPSSSGWPLHGNFFSVLLCGLVNLTLLRLLS